MSFRVNFELSAAGRSSAPPLKFDTWVEAVPRRNEQIRLAEDEVYVVASVIHSMPILNEDRESDQPIIVQPQAILVKARRFHPTDILRMEEL